MFLFFFFQAEDGIRDLVRSRGLGDVYKRQVMGNLAIAMIILSRVLKYGINRWVNIVVSLVIIAVSYTHLTLPTSDLV